jgi:hypothetical protein
VSRVSGWVGRLRAANLRSSRHKLHAVRFGRLVAGLRSLVELGEDATDKLEGDWVFDRRYVASFAQRTLDHAREIVFDSSVLGEGSTELDGRLDAVRGRLDRLLAQGARHRSDAPSATEEEPEYRLLRAAIRALALPSTATPKPGEPTDAPRLAEVLGDAHERALRSFEGLHFRSWGRRAGIALVGSGFPGPVRVVDAGGGVASAAGHDWRSGLGWDRIRSEPFRALLESLALSRTERLWTSPRPSPAALAILSEERSTVTVDWPKGALVLDARLGEHAAANSVYCALRGEPPGSAQPLARVVAESGFRLVGLGPGLTGWMAGRSREDTRNTLGRMGRCLEALLSGLAGGRPIVNGAADEGERTATQREAIRREGRA